MGSCPKFQVIFWYMELEHISQESFLSLCMKRWRGISLHSGRLQGGLKKRVQVILFLQENRLCHPFFALEEKPNMWWPYFPIPIEKDCFIRFLNSNPWDVFLEGGQGRKGWGTSSGRREVKSFPALAMSSCFYFYFCHCFTMPSAWRFELLVLTWQRWFSWFLLCIFKRKKAISFYWLLDFSSLEVP